MKLVHPRGTLWRTALSPLCSIVTIFVILIVIEVIYRYIR